MDDSIFPHVKKAIGDFMYDQEGNIPRNKVLTVGAMMILLSLLLADDVFAAHRSHSSHKSHSSHSSHSSHKSHSSHNSHSNHSNHSSSTRTKPTPTPKPSHTNKAPTLKKLNTIKMPNSKDTVDMKSITELTAAGSTPPATTPYVADAPTAEPPAKDS